MPVARTVRFHWAWWVLAIAVLLAWQYLPRQPAPHPAPSVTSSPGPAGSIGSARPTPAQPDAGASLPAFLPAEAGATIARIRRGGPFPHPQDGGVFGNREGHLPRQPRGWYREYTVDTPGLAHRGTRRIVTGGDPPQAWYYSDDHYASFRRFDPGTARGSTP